MAAMNHVVTQMLSANTPSKRMATIGEFAKKFSLEIPQLLKPEWSINDVITNTPWSTLNGHTPLTHLANNWDSLMKDNNKRFAQKLVEEAEAFVPVCEPRDSNQEPKTLEEARVQQAVSEQKDSAEHTKKVELQQSAEKKQNAEQSQEIEITYACNVNQRNLAGLTALAILRQKEKPYVVHPLLSSLVDKTDMSLKYAELKRQAERQAECSILDDMGPQEELIERHSRPSYHQHRRRNWGAEGDEDATVKKEPQIRSRAFYGAAIHRQVLALQQNKQFLQTRDALGVGRDERIKAERFLSLMKYPPLRNDIDKYSREQLRYLEDKTAIMTEVAELFQIIFPIARFTNYHLVSQSQSMTLKGAITHAIVKLERATQWVKEFCDQEEKWRKEIAEYQRQQQIAEQERQQQVAAQQNQQLSQLNPAS